MREKSKIDETDRRLLSLLQREATLSLEELGERVSLSTNTVWRRIKRLESEGVIVRRSIVLDPVKLGLGLVVFVAVKTRDHSTDWLDAFQSAISQISEVIEVHRMAGEIDYMLKILARDIADYDRIYKMIIKKISVDDISAGFSMECIKSAIELPIRID